MTETIPEALVTTEWLAERLGDSELRIVDASLPGVGRNEDMAARFRDCHIPGAVFFDIDDIADPEDPLPHMLPSADLFAAKVGALGIGNSHRVVVYDQHGLYSAPRAWWMFRVFGHEQVAVLDGGLPKWRAENRPVSNREDGPPPCTFAARLDRTLVRVLDDLVANLERHEEQVLDARSSGRFAGTETEPRPELRSGHIPHSLNLPYSEIVRDGCMVDEDALIRAFARAGITSEKPVVTTCGSGITACILALGLHLIGRNDVAVYDGSWSEWGARNDTPVECAEGATSRGART